MIITISDMWKNQQKMLDNDNQIKLSSLIVFLADLAQLAECCMQETENTLQVLDFLRRCEEPRGRARKLDRYVLHGHEFLVFPGNPKGNKSRPAVDRMPRMDWDKFVDRLDACALWKRFYRMSKASFFELLSHVRADLERDDAQAQRSTHGGAVSPEGGNCPRDS